MVRLTTSVLAASLLAIPALAASIERYERSVGESDLYGRDFLDAEDLLVAREELEDLFGREFVNDIEERSPRGGSGGHHGRRELEDEFDLEAREPGRFGAAFRIAKGLIHRHGHHAQQFMPQQQNSDQNQRREFDEDLEAREPGRFGAAFRIAKGLVHKHGHHAESLGQFIPQQNNDQNYGREFDEEFDIRDFDDDLEAREPGRFGAAFRIAKGLIHRHGHHAQQFMPQQQNSDQNQRREFDEDLEAREPGRFGAAFRIAKGLIHRHGHHAEQFVPQQQSNDQNQRREFDDEFDIRDFEDDLEAREPGRFGAAFRIAKGLIHRHGHHAQQFDSQQSNDNQRREFDEELDVRDFDDDLEAREPGRFGAAFRIAKNLVHRHGHHAQQFVPQQQNNDQNQRREFDELDDLLEREYFDELD